MIRLLALLFLLALPAQAQVTLKFRQLNFQHGMATSASFNYANQATVSAADGTDCVTAQEVSTGDLGSWDTAFTASGFSRSHFAEHLMGGEGNAIWCRDSTVTVTNTYSRQLVNVANPTSGSTTSGWNTSSPSDIRRTAVAIRATKSGVPFFLVSVHLCPSACADSNGSQFSVQRVSQAEDFVSWAAANLPGVPSVPVFALGDYNLTRTMPKSPSGFQLDVLTEAGYVDLWPAGITAGTATANWGDRNSDGQPDMPLGTTTTRTHDTRGIDYMMVWGTVTLVSIDVPDLRETCPHGLVNQGDNFPACSPEVNGGPGVSGQQWDIPEDFGVRPSDHNLMTVTVTIAAAAGIGGSVRGKVTLRGAVRVH